jgi:DNA-binding FadR family transcriptional regulator
MNRRSSPVPRTPLSRQLPKRLHEHVVDELGARIVRGEFKPDEALPIEDALVAQLGVSRTVVREAVKVLAQKKLIEVRTRTGTRVCAPSRWNQLDPDILRWRFAGEFDAKLLTDLIDLRRIIEPAAAELAAERATPAKVAALRATFAEMSDEGRVEEHIAADLRFHLGILEAAGNDLLFGLRHSIEGALEFAIGFSTHSKDDGIGSLALHRAVLDAIAQGKPARARAAMNTLVGSWAADCQRIAKAQRAKSRRGAGSAARARAERASQRALESNAS